jgi:hypothetical protein
MSHSTFMYHIRRQRRSPPPLLGYRPGKNALAQAKKAYGQSRNILLLILNFDASWMWVVNITYRPLYPWEGTTLPIE